MKITIEGRPEVEVTLIDLAGNKLDFRNEDGLNSAPLEFAGEMPTLAEIQAAVEAVIREELPYPE